jgi:Rhodanese-like domain
MKLVKNDNGAVQRTRSAEGKRLMNVGKSLFLPLSCVALAAALALGIGCRKETARKKNTSDNPTTASPPAKEITTWPADPSTHKLRQVTKHAEDLQRNASLFLISHFPRSEMPDWDIDPLGIKRVNLGNVEALVDSKRWLVIDVRIDADVLSTGTIPGAVHHQYDFEGADQQGSTRLTPAVIQEALTRYDGVILVCNGVKCPRSFNACLAIVQEWSFPSQRIRWFREGVTVWTRSPLIQPQPAPVAAVQ